MHRPVALAVVALGLSVGQALAQEQAQTTIWSCKDKDGRTHVTNLREDTVGKSCKVVVQQRVTVVPAPSGAKQARMDARPPRETQADRAQSKDRQRSILENELAEEQKALGRAKEELAEQASVRAGDERSNARVQERLQKYKDNVEVHEKNIEALRRELSNLYR